MRFALDPIFCFGNLLSDGKIVKFTLSNDDWKALNDQEKSDEHTEDGKQENSDKNTVDGERENSDKNTVDRKRENSDKNTVDRKRRRPGLNLKLPASYDQWMYWESLENGLQIILKDTEKAAKDKALYCYDSDWRAVLERYLFASENSYSPDIILEVGPENTPFHVHKFVLALGCDVFRAMFYGGLAEKGEKVCIPDMSPEGFKVLLRYLYGSLIVLTDEEEAFSAWIVADKYCVQQLKQECEEVFALSITTGNVWAYYETALYSNMRKLISRCRRFILRYTEASLCGKSFYEAKLETVQKVFNMPILRISELLLITLVVDWGWKKTVIGKPPSLRDILKPALPHFPFCALTPGEFCTFLNYKYDLLDDLEALFILKHLTKPFTYPLPKWCAVRQCAKYHNTNTQPYKYKYLYKYLEKKQRRRAAKKLKTK